MADRSAAARKAWVTRRAGRGPAVLASMQRMKAMMAKSADALGQQWAKPDSKQSALMAASRKVSPASLGLGGLRGRRAYRKALHVQKQLRWKARMKENLVSQHHEMALAMDAAKRAR